MYSDELNSTNGAVLAGFDKQILAESQGKSLDILVKSTTDYATKFRAFDLHAMEYIWLNGWEWNFHVHVIEA